MPKVEELTSALSVSPLAGGDTDLLPCRIGHIPAQNAMKDAMIVASCGNAITMHGNVITTRRNVVAS
jgi:hypothetical protein